MIIEKQITAEKKSSKAFDVPVVLFIFKRVSKAAQIINEIKKVAPKTIYIISDSGRDPQEQILVEKCRREVENAVDWECKLILNYADSNEGVYKRIGLGALWVLSREEKAIFLEDDNLPEESFFLYCETLLERYEDNDDILWICGTNYLVSCDPRDGSDYFFSRCMLPCGWATWSNKFSRYYEKSFCKKNRIGYKQYKRLKKTYLDKRLLWQDVYCYNAEIKHYNETGMYYSWDMHMSYSIRLHNKYGIIPKYNQIRNIGVDDYSTHGGTSYEDEMTRRFCGLPTRPFDFPLKHPTTVMIDQELELRTERVIIWPESLRKEADITFFRRFKHVIRFVIRGVFDIPDNIPIKEYFCYKCFKRKNQ